MQGASEAYTDITSKIAEYYTELSKQESATAAIQRWRELNTQVQQYGKELPLMIGTINSLGDEVADDKRLGPLKLTLVELASLANELGLSFDGTAADLERTNAAIEEQAAGMAGAADDLESTRQAIQATLNEYIKDGVLTNYELLDLSAMFASLDSSETRTQALAAISSFFDGFEDQFDAGLEDAKAAFNATLEGEDFGGTWSDTLASQLSYYVPVCAREHGFRRSGNG